ncbi:MATE family efflux transporter [Roseococcus suduntuyensis]|uniref:Na+-driven multidrug efflux pump n=1 Tax=Roseococcus suduntuyensis TaxID=455361 RepID=A0A840AAX2_9PROT|nr:MATE family efflux transporter [Roseococcus suduntuyensis]MBB3897414.1 Na+-driven multidrug efflux pump [Roseococcus suduntuyensis]
MRPSARELARRILALAAPTTLLSALQVAALLVETWIAARLGREALAGWAVVLPFALLLGQMSAGAMGGGVVSAIARALGAKQPEEAAALALHALLIALGFAMMFVVVLAVFPWTVLGWIGGPVAAAAGAPYAAVMFGLGAIPAWLANTLASILRGGGRHGLAARVLNLAWLAYPALGFLLADTLGMGLVGLGLSFALCFWVAAGVMAAVVASGAAGFAVKLRVPLRWARFQRILAVGATACLLAFVANLTTILVTARLAVHGAAAVAAYGVAARLEFMMIPLAFGVGSALTALVGRAVGGGDWETARRTAWVGGGMALALCSAIGVSVAVWPMGFAMLFASDAEVARIAAEALRWIGPAFGGFGLGMAMYFAAMGAGKMGWPVVAGFSRLGIAVVGGWLLSDVVGMGMAGQFLAVALGITAYGVLAAGAVRRGVWGG